MEDLDGPIKLSCYVDYIRINRCNRIFSRELRVSIYWKSGVIVILYIIISTSQIVFYSNVPW